MMKYTIAKRQGKGDAWGGTDIGSEH